MDFTFKKLTFQSGKEQLLIEFSPKSDILSSFVEGEFVSFGKEILASIQQAIDTKAPVSFAGNSCEAVFEKEYSRIESQFDEKFIILKTDELVRILHSFLEELSK